MRQAVSASRPTAVSLNFITSLAARRDPDTAVEKLTAHQARGFCRAVRENSFLGCRRRMDIG
jgi:hypothetical protein